MTDTTTASSSLASSPIKVDVWSDIACPWCYIGKRKFEDAAARFDGEVEVEYHSFELSPDTPVDFEGDEVDFIAKHKGMPADQVRGMLDQVTGIAAEVGLAYDFGSLHHTNTVKAHQLLHFAKARGRTLLELAFSWLAAKPVVSSVIAGATKPEQLEANVRATEWTLTPEDLAEIDAITA